MTILKCSFLNNKTYLWSVNIAGNFLHDYAISIYNK